MQKRDLAYLEANFFKISEFAAGRMARDFCGVLRDFYVAPVETYEAMNAGLKEALGEGLTDVRSLCLNASSQPWPDHDTYPKLETALRQEIFQQFISGWPDEDLKAASFDAMPFLYADLSIGTKAEGWLGDVLKQNGFSEQVVPRTYRAALLCEAGRPENLRIESYNPVSGFSTTYAPDLVRLHRQNNGKASVDAPRRPVEGEIVIIQGYIGALDML